MPNNPFLALIKPYFDYLAGFADNFANESVKHGVEPDDIVRDFLQGDGRKERFAIQMLPEISGYVVTFWKRNLGAVIREIEKLPGLRARFGGDIGPQSRDKLYQRLGIYFDSIIVPDPILRSIVSPNKWTDYYILKFATNLTLNRDAYLADVYPPIAVLLGEEHLVNASDHYAELAQISHFDSVQLANRLFGKAFDTYDEALAFAAKFKSDEEIIKEVNDPSLFLVFDGVGRTVEEQLVEMDREHLIHFDTVDLPRQMVGPERLIHTIQGRMMQVNELLMHSSEIAAHPVIQAPVTFHWLEAKLKANADVMSEALQTDLMVQLPLTNGLLAEKLQWLSNIPVPELVRLREQGFLSELRETIGTNLKDLSEAGIEDFRRISNSVDVSLNTALNRHQESLQSSHNEALDGLALSVPSLLVSVAGMVLPLFGVITPWTMIAAGVVGAASLKDIIPNLMKLKRAREVAEKTPMGILWAAREAEDKNSSC